MEFKRFKIKDKVWSWGGHSNILNDYDELCYIAKGKVSFKPKMILFDAVENEVLHIMGKVLSFKPKFYIYRDDVKIYEVTKTFALKSKIIVESLTDGPDFEIKGNIWGTEYKFYSDGEEVGIVSDKMWSMANNFGLAIDDRFDETVILAIVIIIGYIKKQTAAAAAS